MITSQTTKPKQNAPTIYVYLNLVNGNVHIYDEDLKLYRYGNMTEANAIEQFRCDTKQRNKTLNIRRIR